MFRVYSESLEIIRSLRDVISAFEKRDPDLARQLRRASSSVALNIAEANGSRGRNRGARFHTALGSLRETLSCVEVGHALGYVDPLPEIAQRIDRLCGALYCLAR
jgi:four helix bundle protein